MPSVSLAMLACVLNQTAARGARRRHLEREQKPRSCARAAPHSLLSLIRSSTGAAHRSDCISGGGGLAMDFLLSEVEFRALFSAFDCGSSQRVRAARTCSWREVARGGRHTTHPQRDARAHQTNIKMTGGESHCREHGPSRLSRAPPCR
jgi:hypothetical protein